MVKSPRNRILLKNRDFISHVTLTFKIKDVKSLSIAPSRIKHDNVKITRKGGAGLQRDNNLAGKIQREWTLGISSAQASADFLTISGGFALEVILTHQIISTKSTK
jgi:hypothetical protein